MSDQNLDDWADALEYTSEHLYRQKYGTGTYMGLGLGQSPSNYIPTPTVRTKPKPCYGCGKACNNKYDGIYYCNDCHEPHYFTTVNLSADRTFKDQAWTNLKKLQYCGIELDNNVLCEPSTCYTCDGPLGTPFPGDDTRISCWKCCREAGQGSFWDRPIPCPELDMLSLQRNLQHSLGVPQAYMMLGGATLERQCYICAGSVTERDLDDASDRFTVHLGCLARHKESIINSLQWDIAPNCHPTAIEDQMACYCCGNPQYSILLACRSFRLCLNCYWAWIYTEKDPIDKWTQPHWGNEKITLWGDPEYLAQYTGRPLEEFQTLSMMDGQAIPTGPDLGPLGSQEDNKLFMKHMSEQIDKIFYRYISAPIIRYPISITGI